jgi:hypothetical protein
MTNSNNSFSSKQTLEISAQALLGLAEKIQKYRLAELNQLSGSELNSLNNYESQVRDKALKISAKAIDGILESKLKPATNGLKQSIDQTNQALNNLKEISNVIQGLTRALEFANNVFKVIT